MALWAFQKSSHGSAWDKCFLRLPLAKPLITNIQSGPDDDLLRGSLGQSEGFNCGEELGSCNRLISAMQYASSSSQRGKQATTRKDPRDAKATAAEAGVFSLGSPAPICEHMTAHDVQRAEILNKEVIGDWQLRVPVSWRETTEPENVASVSFPSRFFDCSLYLVQVEGCWNSRAIINAMEH